jgi:hypothetical protein
MGSLYRPKLKDWRTRPASDQRSAVWWCKFYVNGRPVRESTGTEDKEETKRILKKHEGAAASGQPIVPRLDRIRFDELTADLRLHYQTTGRRDLKDVEKHLRRLGTFFGGWRAVAIDEAAITQYIARRQAGTTRRGGPPANGTINRELSLLGTLFRLAASGTKPKVLHPPHITLLKEAAPRAGFFEAEQFAAVRRRLPRRSRWRWT